MKVRLFTEDLCLHRRGFRQIGEGAVVHAAQTGEHGVLQIEIDLRFGPEHLQAADLRLKRGNRLGEQSLIIMARADDDLLRGKTAGGAVQMSRLDVAHQGGKVKLDAEVAAQVVDQCRDGFARVQLLIVNAVQRSAVMAELAAIKITQRGCAKQFDVVAVLDRASGAERFEQVFFGFAAGEQIGAVALDLQSGELRPVCLLYTSDAADE